MDEPKILFLTSNEEVLAFPGDASTLKVCEDSLQEVARLCREDKISGLVVPHDNSEASESLIHVLNIASSFTDGLALLDKDQKILWCNTPLIKMLDAPQINVEPSFYDLFGDVELLDHQLCPIESCRLSGEIRTSTLKLEDKQYFEVRVAPVFFDENGSVEQFLACVRNTTTATFQRQKLNAIYQAGLELGDLSPQEMIELTVDERIELLKSKILHYTNDLLEFETVEIRLIDKNSTQLRPLLAMGMQAVAAERKLYADPKNNGVTGFVAASGKSYLCDDITNDPLYLPGAPGAKSSMTVPLILHDEVLGTFNVESPLDHAFDENDLQFLELFSREVAVALNTLDLLAIEKAATVNQSMQKILQQVATPVDEILNDAAWILERYIGHEPNVADRLRQILKHTRDIKQRIREVGETITPEGAHPRYKPKDDRPQLRDKRILVVDSDEAVRRAAHELLGRFGCQVETAHDGGEACLLVKSSLYDAVIVDIRLDDMTGFECFCKLREIYDDLPVILMTGFGYDPNHCIVKARQMGLKSVLYKPFRLDQLVNEVEAAVVTNPNPSE